MGVWKVQAAEAVLRKKVRHRRLDAVQGLI